MYLWEFPIWLISASLPTLWPVHHLSNGLPWVKATDSQLHKSCKLADGEKNIKCHSVVQGFTVFILTSVSAQCPLFFLARITKKCSFNLSSTWQCFHPHVTFFFTAYGDDPDMEEAQETVVAWCFVTAKDQHEHDNKYLKAAFLFVKTGIRRNSLRAE